MPQAPNAPAWQRRLRRRLWDAQSEIEIVEVNKPPVVVADCLEEIGGFLLSERLLGEDWAGERAHQRARMHPRRRLILRGAVKQRECRLGLRSRGHVDRAQILKRGL